MSDRVTAAMNEVLHKARPDNEEPQGVRGWWCATCGWRIEKVPGGHGSTWVHAATRTVWGDGPEKPEEET